MANENQLTEEPGATASRLRSLAQEMEDMGGALQVLEKIGLVDGAFQKGSEMRGAADMAREWASHLEQILPNVERTREATADNKKTEGGK